MLSRLRALFARREPARPVLVHAHMFKNAGTTLDWSLQRSFGEHFTDHRDDDDMKRGAAYFGPWLQAHPDCQAVSSHWITQPLPALPEIDIALCLLFRDPVERMRSVYQFERQQEGVDTPGSIRAKKMSFYEYMSWQMEPMPGPVVKNYHTRYCSGEYLGDDLPTMYERALALLNSTPLVGLVHRYDESMVLFEHHLRSRFPSIDLSYLKQNVLSAADQDLESRRTSVLEELDDITDTVLAANSFDLQLHDAATQRFEDLLAAVPDLDTRLDDLRGSQRGTAAGVGLMIPSWLDARRPPPTDQGYLRAAHYFGDGWPINCWSTMNPQQARADFAQMREDGFNAVILVVPYRGFQVTQSPPRYEKHYFKLLQQLIREASRAHLWVILRIGYAHHICDKAPVMSGELTRRQITDSQYDAPWLHYLKRLRRVLAPHRNVRHLFLCWEEFWHGFMWMTRVSEKKRRELTPGSGYAEYLGDPGAIIPQESEPAFEHFHRFANQRLREIYTRCREVFPELGFEFRVDKDPLHNADGSVSWLSNDYMLDSGALRLSYWAPFIGARNEGEELSVEEALGLLRYNLSEQTNEGNNTRLLIDQFNFIDDTHKYVDQHARLNDEALPEFLSACAELLPQYSEGYGLWAWRDYRQNHLFNPDFRMGLAGWQATAGRPRRLRWGKEGVMLKEGDCLGQDFNALGHGMHARFQTSHCTLELTVGAASDVSLEASLDDQHFVALQADEVAGTLRCELPIDPAIYKSRKVKFRLRVVSGQAQLLSTSLYQYDYQVGVRGIDGEPGPYLTLVREFNKALAANDNA